MVQVNTTHRACAMKIQKLLHCQCLLAAIRNVLLSRELSTSDHKFNKKLLEKRNILILTGVERSNFRVHDKKLYHKYNDICPD